MKRLTSSIIFAVLAIGLVSSIGIVTQPAIAAHTPIDSTSTLVYLTGDTGIDSVDDDGTLTVTFQSAAATLLVVGDTLTLRADGNTIALAGGAFTNPHTFATADEVNGVTTIIWTLAAGELPEGQIILTVLMTGTDGALTAVHGTTANVDVDRVIATVDTATINLNDPNRQLVITFDEIVDRASVATALGANAISVSIPGGDGAGLPDEVNLTVGPAVLQTAGDSSGMVFTLTEVQRVAINEMGTDLRLNIAAGGFADNAPHTAGNTSILLQNFGIGRTADTTVPTAIDGTIEFDPVGGLATLLLTIDFSETIDADPTTNVDLTKIFVSPIGIDFDPAGSLVGATAVIASEDDVAPHQVVIQFTEAQRQAFVAMNTPQLDLQAGAFRDMSGVLTAQQTDLTLTPLADATPPTIDTVTVNLNNLNRQLVVDFSETMDVGSVDTDTWFIEENGADNGEVPFFGATLGTTVDSEVLIFTLTEQQRQNVIVLTTPELRIGAGDITDIAGTGIGAITAQGITETADNDPPSIVRVTIDRTTSVKTVNISYNEIIDISTIDITKFNISAPSGVNQVPLLGNDSVTNVDDSVIQIVLSVAQLDLVNGLGATVELDAVAEGISDFGPTLSGEQLDTPIVETTDSTAPTIVSATFNADPSLSTLIINFSEIADANPSTNVDVTLLTIQDSVAATAVNIDESIVNVSESTSVTIQLSEADRVALLNLPNTAQLDTTADAFRDLSNNRIATQDNLDITIVPDTTAPSIVSTTINLDPANALDLDITFTEAIDADPISNVLLANLFVSAPNQTEQVGLTNAATAISTGPTVTITLDENTRRDIVALGSDTLELDVRANSFIDLSVVPIALSPNNSIDITADTTDPTFVSSTLNLNDNNRQLKITLSEAMDASAIDLSLLSIQDTTLPAELVQLDGASFATTDGNILTITLTEQQRAGVLGFTNVPQLDILAESLFDITGNGIEDDTNNAMTITADTTVPELVSAEINANPTIATLTLEFNETMGFATETLLNNLDVSSVGGVDEVDLSAGPAAVLLTDADSTTMVYQLTAVQLVAINALNNPELDIKAGVDGLFSDVAVPDNPLPVTLDFPVNILVDAAAPQLDTVNNPITLDFDPANPDLVITFDEDVSAVVADIDLALVFISATNGSNEISLADAGVAVANTVVTITLTENQRAAALALNSQELDLGAAAFQDLAGNSNAADTNVGITITADVVDPAIDDADANEIILNANSAVRKLSVYFDEPVDVSTVDKSLFAISEVAGERLRPLTASTVITTVDGNLVQFTLTTDDAAAIELLATPVLDMDVAAVQDLSGRNVVADLGVVATLLETTDNTKPTIRIAPNQPTLNLTGATPNLVIVFDGGSGNIDITPNTNIDLTKLSIQEQGGGATVQLVGATLPAATDGLTVTLTLTAEQRDAITQMTTPQLDVLDSAVRDVAANFNAQALNTSIAITADETGPTLVDANMVLNLNPDVNTFLLDFNESVDATSVDFDQLSIQEQGGGASVALNTGATVLESDATSVTLQLTEQQRVDILALTTPELDMLLGAIEDISGNVNTADLNNDIGVLGTITADAVRPLILSAVLNFDPAVRTLTITLDESVDVSLTDLADINVSPIGELNTLDLNIAAGPANVVSTITDGPTVVITLAEVDRATIAAMDTPQLDIEAAAFTDVSGNPIIAIEDIAISLTADTTPPTVDSVTLNIDPTVGTLVITFDEAMDDTPTDNVDLSKIFISPTGQDSVLQLNQDSAVVNQQGDGVIIQITLTAGQLNTVALMNTPQLELSAGAVQDISAVANAASESNIILVDAIAPQADSATLDTTSGVLVITFNETIDNVGTVLLTNVFISPEGGNNQIPMSAATLTSTTNGLTSTITLDAATLASVNALATTQLDISAGAYSDVSGNPIGNDVNNTITAPVGLPTLTIVSIASDNTDNTTAVAGDTVTVSFTGSEVIQGIAVTIDGNAADAVTDLGSNNWTGTRVMQAGDTVGVVAFTIDFQDVDANVGTQVTATTDDSSVTFAVTAAAGITDLAVIRDGFWFIDLNLDGVADIEVGFGLPTDTLFQGDFNGDGIEDLVVNRDGFWFIDTGRDGSSNDAGDIQVGFGLPTDTLFRGDFNGDGIDDLVVNRDGFWFIDTGRDGSSNDAGDIQVGFGLPTDTLFTGDYNGDGADDITVIRDGFWFIDTNHNGSSNDAGDIQVAFGLATDKHLVGDFDGDGTDDLVVNRDGFWFIDTDLDGVANISVPFGLATDTPFVGDFNGDGISDLVVNRDGFWFIDTDLDGVADIEVPFGLATDRALVGDFGS